MEIVDYEEYNNLRDYKVAKCGYLLPGRVSGGVGLLVTARLGLVADGRTAPHGTTRCQHPVALHGVALGDSRLARTHSVRSPHYKTHTLLNINLLNFF